MNTRPEIYTEEFVLNEVKDILKCLISDSEIIYKGELFLNRPYSRQRLSEWRNRFDKNQEISDTIGKIDEILETRAVVGGLKNRLSSNIVKFHLSNNYNWRDKATLENEIVSQTKHIIVFEN